MGDGNDTFATADPLADQGGYFEGLGELDPVETDADFYTFTTSGPVAVLVDCKPDGDEFALEYPDLVVSVYDNTQFMIARNDDPYPRNSQDPTLLTVLPAAGTYYLKVEEYCHLPGSACDPDYFNGIFELDYDFTIVPIDPAIDGWVFEGPEPNDTAANATPIEYSGSGGVYLPSGELGTFAGITDVDALSFSVPPDLSLDANQRAVATFVLPPGSFDESGSSVQPGVAEIVNPATQAVIARFDLTNEPGGTLRMAGLFAPVPVGTPMLFRVDHGTSAIGSAPFLFVQHTVGGGNPVEAADIANNTFATAEVLPVFPGTFSYFVEGDLTAGDQDHYRIAVEPGLLSVVCVAERGGSGVRGLTATVLRASDGVALDLGTETATDDLFVFGVDPGAETQLVVLLTKTSQDPVVTGTYYRCGLTFVP